MSKRGITDDEMRSILTQLCALGMASTKDGGQSFSLTPCGKAFVEAMPFENREPAVIWAAAWAAAKR